MKLWIFDLDGTLTDSFPVFFRSMQEIFQARGKTISAAQLNQALGCGMPGFFTEHLGAEHAPAALEELRRLSVAYVSDVKPFPGIEACLDGLRASGRELAVWTARDRESTGRVLEASGLARFASHVVTGCCVSRNKPDPEGALKVIAHFGRAPGDSLMVGDHLHDVSAARAAGIQGIRASWNPYWNSEPCEVAAHQFFTVADFTAWARERAR